MTSSNPSPQESLSEAFDHSEIPDALKIELGEEEISRNVERWELLGAALRAMPRGPSVDLRSGVMTEISGKPTVAADGSIFVADFAAGRVYRLYR